MRVLQVFKNYYPPTHGGVEQFINELVHSEQMREGGIECSVLTAAEGRQTLDERDGNVRVVRASTMVRASTAPLVPSWRSWMRRLEPDVVHLHMPNPWAEVVALSLPRAIPLVASFHGEITRAPMLMPPYRLMLRRLWRRVHSVQVGSPRLLETAPELEGARDRAVIIPYGVDPSVWAERPALADEIRARYNTPIVLFLGKIRHYKGLHVLVDAMREVDATLLVAGDGSERAGAEAQVAQYGIGDRVHFVGAIVDDERSAYYHAADVFALPSVNRGESYGIVQVEAMATGTPVVSTELGTGTSWVNQDGQTGLVVPAGDVLALAAALRAILSDDERRAEMGRAAQQRVRDHLTKAQMFGAIRQMYERAAQAR